jgi:hypothetical protein
MSRNLPWWGWLLAAAGLTVLAVIWRVDPAGQLFYPRCWLYQTTGLKCPGCGATRALHALLNGHVADAFRLNPLIFVLSPAAAWLAVRGLRGWRTGRWWPNPLVHPIALAILGGLVVGFGIARNVF